MTELIAHLESHLGAISGGTNGDESTPEGLQVAWFGANRPYTGVTTIATLGLSRHHLAQSGSKGLHQELLMHLPMASQPRNAAGLLLQVAAELLLRGRGLLRGEVIGPRGPLIGSGQMTALNAAAPGYLPPGFDICDTGTITIVMTWLIPITATEAHYVHTQGWPAFEETLAAEDPDLADLSRSPVTAATAPGKLH